MEATRTPKNGIAAILAAHPIQVATIFAIVTACIYQKTYWDKFGVNVLEYTPLLEMVKLTVWPFIALAMAISFGVVLRSITHVVGRGDLEPPIRTTKEALVLSIVVFVPIAILLAIAVIKESPERWLLWAITGAIASTFSLKAFEAPTQFVKEQKHGAVALLAVVALPWLAWGMGKEDSEKVWRGIAYQIAVVTPSFRDLHCIPTFAELRYLGGSGTHTLLLIADGPRASTLVVQADELPAIEYLHSDPATPGVELTSWKNVPTACPYPKAIDL